MIPDDFENLRKFSICDDQFGDGMTLVPQSLLKKALGEINRLENALVEIKLKGVTTGYGRAALAYIARTALRRDSSSASASTKED